MTPYYEHAGIQIWLGDCREILPTLQADLVVTDPPYGMNFRSCYRIVKHDAIAGDAFLPLDLINMAIAAATRAAYVFCRWDNLSDHEFIKRIPDVIFAERTGNDLHATQKPENLMRTIIHANVGDMVLDPFMGSGTTLVAAKNLGRKAIGIEIEERYCEIAAKRLSQEVFNFEQ
jgi:site-specific DNA-methyltransferase (adenine-specific)